MKGDRKRGTEAVELFRSYTVYMKEKLTAEGLSELRRVADMDERPSNAKLAPWAIGGG